MIGLPTGGTCEDFNPGAGVDATLQITAGGDPGTILQWAEPWNGVTTNLDLYILDSAGTTVLARARSTTSASRSKPFEFAGGGLGAAPTRSSSGATAGARARPGSSSPTRTAATGTAQEYLSSGQRHRRTDDHRPQRRRERDHRRRGQLRRDAAPEPYSSRGPLTLRFGPVSGVTPAAPALVNPQPLAKPDITASDCGADTFFGGGDVLRNLGGRPACRRAWSRSCSRRSRA